MGRTSRFRQWAERLYPFFAQGAFYLADRRGQLLLREAEQGKQGAVPLREELSALLGIGNPDELARVQERSARCHARTVLVKEIVTGRGLGVIRGLVAVDASGLARLEALIGEGSPVIVVTWHAGPTPAIWSLLAGVDRPLLKLQNRVWEKAPGHWTMLNRSFEAGEGLRILREARKHLSAGGWMGMGFDHFEEGTSGHLVPCFNREMKFPGGVATLSLMTGAAILPVSARWAEAGPRIHVDIGEPIRPPAVRTPELERGGEAAANALMLELVGRMENFMLRYPWEMNGRRIRAMLQFPPLNAPRGDPRFP